MKAKIALYKGEDGFWVVEAINMPGCASQGETREEALSMIQDAMRGWLAVMREEHPEFAGALPDVEIVELDVAA